MFSLEAKSSFLTMSETGYAPGPIDLSPPLCDSEVCTALYELGPRVDPVSCDCGAGRGIGWGLLKRHIFEVMKHSF